MKINQTFPSKRLLLTLFFCASSVILLQNYNISFGTSFLTNILSLVCAVGACAVIFLPSVILKKKYNTDLITASRAVTPRFHYVMFGFYIAYFVFAIEYFLIRYTNMFNEKYFSESSVDLIALTMLAICTYSACRGTNIITRFGIFLFAFAIVCFLLIFGGSISALDFSHYGFEFGGSPIGAASNGIFFATVSFIAVIFVCTSTHTENFKIRQAVMLLVFLALEFALFLFFGYFALGDFSQGQSYQSYVLSRISHINGVSGIDSFYFGLTTLCVFAAVSLCLCSVNRGLNENKPILNTSIISAIAFALHFCAVRLNFVKEILINPFLFCILTVIFAAIVPFLYLITFRRRLYA